MTVGFYFTLSSQGYRYDVGWYDADVLFVVSLVNAKCRSAALVSICKIVEVM